jgi:hypothetical protein
MHLHRINKLPRAVLALALASSAVALPANALAGGSHHHHRHAAHHMSGIPQHNGGDRDSDNNGGPSDGDGNI